MGEPAVMNVDRPQERDAAGFTLVELLVVISIIGILAAIATFAFSKTRGKSVESACRSDFKSVELAMEAYKTKTGVYPTQTQLINGTTILKPGGYPNGGEGYSFAVSAPPVIQVSGPKVVGGSTIDGCNASP